MSLNHNDDIRDVPSKHLGEGEVQGGTIEVYTTEDDGQWNENIEEVERLWQKIKE